MGVVLVLKIWNEICRLILWVWVKMVKNRIELFRRLFALGREVLIFVVRYKQKWPPPPRENFIVFHKWFVLKSPKNQSITNILTASVVIRMLIGSLLSNQWWGFFCQEVQRIKLVTHIWWNILKGLKLWIAVIKISLRRLF